MPRTLAVVLHGLGSNPGRMADVRDAVRAAYGSDTRVETPAMSTARLWSSVRATRIVRDLLRDIDRWVAECRPERIVLIGHSVGATLARRVFLVAAGCPGNFRPEPDLGCEAARPWAARVERVVLLAAYNRGWKISPRLSWRYTALFNVVGLLGHLLRAKQEWTPTAFDFRLGATFMAQTRLHWLAYRRMQQGPDALASPTDQPVLIQLLGTQDDLVSPFDQVDIAVDGSGRAVVFADGTPTTPDAPVQDYFLVEQPFTDHEQAVRMSAGAAPDSPEGVRRARFVEVLRRDRAGLARPDLALDPTLLADEIDPIEPHVRDTVFVIHGIRDDGYWTHRIAERVRRSGDRDPDSDATVFRSWTPTYGYFAMLPFILPWIRREKVEWFMDQYVTAFAQYPNSDFHYVGHSNGTYLVARALRDYPALHLKHVFFAGSVVRCDYPWVPLIDARRVRRVQNVRADGDWVVAWLPKSLDWIPAFDLGGGGFDGFAQAGHRPEITEFHYVRGGHGAGIAEPHWGRIADFIVHGTPFSPDPASDPGLFATEPVSFVETVGRLRIGIPAVLAVAGLVAWGGVALSAWIGLGGWFGLLAAGLLIRFVVIRV